MSELSILIVEDDPVQMRQMARTLKAAGYEVLQASTGDEAVRILNVGAARLVLTDRKMPGMNGDLLLQHIRANYPGMPVAMITAYPEGIEDLKPDAVLVKPFSENQLTDLTGRLSDQRTA